MNYSPKKEYQIEMNNAYHLEVLQLGFQSGTIDENLIKNLNETHFTINMDNGCTLGFYGDTSIKYANVVAREMPWLWLFAFFTIVDSS